MPGKPAFHALSRLACLALTVSLTLLGCVKNPATDVPSSPVLDLAPSQTPTPLTLSDSKDVMILSLQENGYAHLFAYAPGNLPLTRLTAGDWNDITPALSPDGKQVAFASNRSGYWDLYTLDLRTGNLNRLTNTPPYDAAPSWSPDMAWIAYETLQNGNLQIALLSLINPDQPPVILTPDASSSSSPAWSPDGRQIAFVSNRNGDTDIWLADLNQASDSRFTDISHTPQAAESHPAWSPDGSRLAWASASENMDYYSGIYIWDVKHPDRPAVWVGDGDWPAWNSRGDEIAASINGPNEERLTAYTLQGEPLLLPTPLPGYLRGIIWPSISLPRPLPQAFQQAVQVSPAALWAPAITPVTGVPAQRWYVVPLQNVQAPYPELHDLVDEAFTALRQRVIKEAGWDALASLENAYVPLTTSLDPGLGDDWLYTGRAFAVNSLMINVGWMAVVREDIGSQTYWRLYLRAQKQDGSQGEPIQDSPWDLNARYELDPITYEAGGKYAAIPGGYWVDLTALAQAYGWERLPALPNWRNYFAGARFTEFVMTGGLDWYSAMLELYPPEALVTATAVLPPTATPSNTPVPSSTPGPTRTPRATSTITLTPSPRPPTNTPAPTSTPPTIIPTFNQ